MGEVEEDQISHQNDGRQHFQNSDCQEYSNWFAEEVKGIPFLDDDQEPPESRRL